MLLPTGVLKNPVRLAQLEGSMTRSTHFRAEKGLKVDASKTGEFLLLSVAKLHPSEKVKQLLKYIY